ncbi:hypothetical protein SKAU_G00298490 [Synaphobranchus kaupii]|uniref:Uncharacterized protein n=1 Tax=Synaphobranchus kaupii TaxID=118154 RepID=A0A9Q1IN22_SYNKA|nr:hypothetical protein SKAU_G00298490 [Synaphobranchus kaupii]
MVCDSHKGSAAQRSRRSWGDGDQREGVFLVGAGRDGTTTHCSNQSRPTSRDPDYRSDSPIVGSTVLITITSPDRRTERPPPPQGRVIAGARPRAHTEPRAGGRRGPVTTGLGRRWRSASKGLSFDESSSLQTTPTESASATREVRAIAQRLDGWPFTGGGAHEWDDRFPARAQWSSDLSVPMWDWCPTGGSSQEGRPRRPVSRIATDPVTLFPGTWSDVSVYLRQKRWRIKSNPSTVEAAHALASPRPAGRRDDDDGAEGNWLG